MSQHWNRSLTVSLALAAALLAAGAGADDWLQYRHDERRTNASQDRVALPLTDVWAIPVNQRYPPAVWHGRLYYVGSNLQRRTLVCADARTGVPLWTRALAGSAFAGSEPGPAVTASGVVYVRDWDPVSHQVQVPEREATTSIHHTNE